MERMLPLLATLFLVLALAACASAGTVGDGIDRDPARDFFIG